MHLEILYLFDVLGVIYNSGGAEAGVEASGGRVICLFEIFDSIGKGLFLFFLFPFNIAYHSFCQFIECIQLFDLLFDELAKRMISDIKREQEEKKQTF